MQRQAPPNPCTETYGDPRFMSQSPLDPFQDILGVEVTPERLAENLESYRSILDEIRKLRELDLTEVHPAIIFEPTAPYRQEPEQ
jgi:putative NADH-flavin reductase